jgi:ABC-type nitrate/sulfonate/bicarbonate transport system permease component
MTQIKSASSTRNRSVRVASQPFVYGAVTLSCVLAAWFLATDVLHLVGSSFLPSPVTVIATLFGLTVQPFAGATLVGHLGLSLARWALGVGAGILLGVLLGIVLAWLPPVRAAVTPIFEVLRYIPPFAWVPIAVLWLGASMSAQALVVFIAAFPPCVINTQLGVSTVDPILTNAARTLGASPMTILRRVVVPVAAPSIFTGARIAVSNGWMALVGAELIVGKEGLGFLIAQGQFNGDVAMIFVGIIVIGIVGTLIDFLIARAEVWTLPWKTDSK